MCCYLSSKSIYGLNDDWLDEVTEQKETKNSNGPKTYTSKEIKNEIRQLNEIQRKNRDIIRGAKIYNILIPPLIKYLKNGDGGYQINNVMKYHPPFRIKQPNTKEQLTRMELNEIIDKESIIDINLIDFVRFISTCYGYVYQEEAKRIVNAIEADQIKMYTLRFRCSHTLFLYGTPEYQNICLISAMIYLGIPIDSYFDGTNVLV